MLRKIDLSEISDGNLYSENDMVRIGTSGCVGCHKCCTGMGDSIVLDPLDIHNLTRATGMDFNALLGHGYIEIKLKDNLALPNLSLHNNCCPFLDETYRCTVHEYRPSFCRMFPLGRIYEDGDYKYFNQIHECTYDKKVKVKIKDWLGINDIKSYHDFIVRYHRFVDCMREKVHSCGDVDKVKTITLSLLSELFVKPYVQEDFYEEVLVRLYQLEKIC